MKKTLLLSLFLSLILVVQNARSQGLENFANYAGSSGTYTDGTFTGQDGSTWTYKQCRSDRWIVAPSPCLGKNRTPSGKVYSGTIHNGCGTLNFDYKQGFSTAVNLDVYVNNVKYANVTSPGGTGDTSIVHNSGTINVNVVGDFVIKFLQSDSASSGQVTIDNVSWTGYNSVLPEPTNYPTNFTATAGYFKVTLHWTDATGGQLPSAYLILASNANNIVDPVDGTPVPDDPNLADGSAAVNIFPGVQTYTFTGLPNITHYYFKIYSYTNSGALINYKTDGTVPAANSTTPNGVIIFQRNFNDTILTPMISQNVQGPDQYWGISKTFGTSGSGCAMMGGYSGGTYFLNEDWLITPAMNFDLYTNEILTFMSSSNYTGDPLAVKISSNYNGSGDPNSFTWTDLAPTLSAGGFVWTSSGDIDVSGANGPGIYIAYKYTSTATTSKTWELDDIYVLGTPLVGIGEKTNTTDFSIAPNPSQGMVRLVFNSKGDKEISIMNVTGKKVYQETTDLNIRNIDLTDLSGGIYFVQVTDLSTFKISVKKLIVR
jgi:hypothetical protein